MLHSRKRVGKAAVATRNRLAEVAAKADKELIGVLVGLGGTALQIVLSVLIVAGRFWHLRWVSSSRTSSKMQALYLLQRPLQKTMTNTTRSRRPCKMVI